MLAGQEEHAFPQPGQLLALDSFPGIDPVRMQRLHGVARATLDGQLEPGRLMAMPPEAAMAELQTLPGLGPVYPGPWRPFRTWAGVLFRVAGDRDGLAVEQPRSARDRAGIKKRSLASSG